MKLEADKVLTEWYCPECADVAEVPVSWFQDNGTPSCACGADMRLRHVYTEEEKDGSPLTEDQRETVRTTTFEVIYEDCQQDQDYLENIVYDYLDRMTLEEQIGALTSEREMWPHFLPFDPETGRQYTAEERDILRPAYRNAD